MRACLVRVGWVLLVFALGTAAPAADERFEVGPLKLEVHISRTAALFHVVDQLSQWSYYCHPHYLNALDTLSETDRVMLQHHRAVRAKHGWGEGLEQTFYSPAPLDEALAEGVRQRWLTGDEAATEKDVLLHFAARIDPLFQGQTARLTEFRTRLRTELTARSALIAQFARFTESKPDTVLVCLLPNPDAKSMGGGYNGGRLTVEVPTEADALPSALHELFHVFLAQRKGDIKAATAGVTGLDAETLTESIAYAFAPGLVHAGGAGEDPLQDRVGRDFADSKALSDPLTRFHRFGITLRPLLNDALVDRRSNLTNFLPRAVEMWRGIYELETAREAKIAATPELRTVTIVGVFGRTSDELPSFVKEGNVRLRQPTDFFLAFKEWLPGSHKQMNLFFERAGHEFLFTAPGHLSIRGRLNGHFVSSGTGSFQAFGLQIVPEDATKIVAGVRYSIEPVNTNDRYRWQVAENIQPILLRP